MFAKITLKTNNIDFPHLVETKFSLACMPALPHARACHRAASRQDSGTLIFDCWAIFFIRWSWIARWKLGVPASSHSFSSHENVVLRTCIHFLLAPPHEALISNYFWDIKKHNRCCRALDFPLWLLREKKDYSYNLIVVSLCLNVNYGHSLMITYACMLGYQILTGVNCVFALISWVLVFTSCGGQNKLTQYPVLCSCCLSDVSSPLP